VKKINAVIIVALMFLSHVYASEEPCKQQYVFSFSQQELLDIVSIPNSNLLSIKEKIYSVSKSNYFTVKSGAINGIYIYNGKEKAIEISVKGYEYRPLRAKWINEKLIYFEVWFNPHFGAYWIYDVYDEKVIAHELQNDGWTSFQQCQEHYNNRQ
jgi:hypothetical protein